MGQRPRLPRPRPRHHQQRPHPGASGRPLLGVEPPKDPGDHGSRVGHEGRGVGGGGCGQGGHPSGLEVGRRRGQRCASLQLGATLLSGVPPPSGGGGPPRPGSGVGGGACLPSSGTGRARTALLLSGVVRSSSGVKMLMVPYSPCRSRRRAGRRSWTRLTASATRGGAVLAISSTGIRSRMSSSGPSWLTRLLTTAVTVLAPGADAEDLADQLGELEDVAEPGGAGRPSARRAVGQGLDPVQDPDRRGLAAHRAEAAVAAGLGRSRCGPRTCGGRRGGTCPLRGRIEGASNPSPVSRLAGWRSSRARCPAGSPPGRGPAGVGVGVADQPVAGQGPTPASTSPGRPTAPSPGRRCGRRGRRSSPRPGRTPTWSPGPRTRASRRAPGPGRRRPRSPG